MSKKPAQLENGMDEAPLVKEITLEEESQQGNYSTTIKKSQVCQLRWLVKKSKKSDTKQH